jgi:hypothetical protein
LTVVLFGLGFLGCWVGWFAGSELVNAKIAKRWRQWRWTNTRVRAAASNGTENGE